jgi:hypothetical protein
MKFSTLLPLLLISILLQLVFSCYNPYGHHIDRPVILFVSFILEIPFILFLVFLLKEIDKKTDSILYYTTIFNIFISIIFNFTDLLREVNQPFGDIVIHVSNIIGIMFWVLLFIKLSKSKIASLPISIVLMTIGKILMYIRSILFISTFNDTENITTENYMETPLYSFNNSTIIEFGEFGEFNLNLIHLFIVASITIFYISFNKLYKN